MFIFHSILNNIYSKQHKVRDEKLFGVIATSFSDVVFDAFV